MMVLQVLSLVIQLLPQILKSAGVISPNMSALITDLGSAIPGLIVAIASGGSVTDETIAVLGSLRAEVAVLQADTSLSTQALQMCGDLLEAIDAGLAAYQQAGTATDPSTLAELPTDL